MLCAVGCGLIERIVVVQEVFFQIKGKMHVDIVEKQKKKRIEIPEVWNGPLEIYVCE